MSTLDLAFRLVSPRLNPKPIAPLGAAIAAATALIWLAAFVAAFRSDGLMAWSVGAAFIIYDFGQLLFVAAQARKLFSPLSSPPRAPEPRIAVIVAAYNEAAALPATLDALFAGRRRPDQVIVADDGSTDGTGEALARHYGDSPPPGFLWLRLPHRGKANALNAALAHVEAEVVATVDADTLLAPDALAEMARAFAADPALVVAGGVLEPRCRGGAMAAALQAFQRYEYVRNFLGRFAWSQLESLLLISGAFAAFRTETLRAVGGFDPESLVEDYELIHRIHRRARERGGVAGVRIVGSAFASTDAPASLPAFLRQRRRWFAGFLQTQWWNRDMVGAPRYGALGMAMLPFKCLDAAAPIYGLASFGLLAWLLATGRYSAVLPASGLALAKLGFDLANMSYSLEAYRRWTGRRLPLGLAWGCLLVEPFSFLPLRQLGAARGWVALLAGRMEWGGLSRAQARAARKASTPSL
jgi:cellulose synthase/poly-beta-1,6-N-acetylglucosamine synthase-like glycosyltransferase